MGLILDAIGWLLIFAAIWFFVPRPTYKGRGPTIDSGDVGLIDEDGPKGNPSTAGR